jgi:hypothetical protein
MFTIDGKTYSEKWISDIKFSEYSKGETNKLSSITINNAAEHSGSFVVKRLHKTATNDKFKNAVVITTCYDPNNEIYNDFFGFKELQNTTPDITVFIYNQ